MAVAWDASFGGCECGLGRRRTLANILPSRGRDRQRKKTTFAQPRRGDESAHPSTVDREVRQVAGRLAAVEYDPRLGRGGGLEGEADGRRAGGAALLHVVGDVPLVP